MAGKVCLYLFIICTVLTHVIGGTFSEENIEGTSKALVRNKRVIDRSPDGEQFQRIGDRPYVVNIKLNRRVFCVGAILSIHTVITSARCATFDEDLYKIYSGSTYTYLGDAHDVIRKIVHGRNRDRSTTVDGVALMNVNPPFIFNHETQKIELHTEPILAGMEAVVSGWGGRVFGSRTETRDMRRLRTITVPIMGHRECVNFYRSVFVIRDEYVCTHHEQRQCACTDIGAPLVIRNKLVGVFMGEFELGEANNCCTKPDIFVLVQHSEYNQWIRRNILH